MAAASGGWSGRARDWARHVVVRDAPEPRAAQTLFLLLAIADLTLRAVGETSTADILDQGSAPGVGLALILFAQVTAAVTPWKRLPSWVIGGLPVLDLAGLGLLRLTPDGNGAGILAVVPALWLVWQFGVRGVVAVGATSVVFLGAMPLIEFGLHTTTVSRAVIDPVVLVLISAALWALVTSLREGRVQLADSADELSVARHELRESRAFASAIFDSVDVGLVLLGPSGEYLTINARHQEFMDLAFPEGHAGAAGQLGEVFAADGQRPLARHEMPSLRAAQGEEFDDIRMWVGSDPESRRALSVSARSVLADGVQVGAALAYKDVTDFMRAMAVKDDFVAMVSHEFRTPLTSINGYVSLLLEEEDRIPAEDVRYLKVVARNTERLHRLVTDLLATAKFDGRTLEIDLLPTDVCDVVRGAVEAARPAAEGKGLLIGSAVPASLTALVDPQRFAQVVDNLLSNAIKYTPRGGQVAVSVATFEDHFEFRVEDTGMGISSEERDRLFTRFFRTEAAEASAIHGVGLGLSITKKIVDAHGGRVEVDSSERGSTFTVWLPLHPVREEAPGATRGLTARPTTNSAETERAR